MHSGKKKESNSDNDGISLNKYISSSGFCSRRDADKYIEQLRVTINGELATAGMRVAAKDLVEIDGERIKSKNKDRPIYIALNKPVGVTSTTDLKDKTNIISFLNYPKRIFPIGRLDKDSDGLIFLTNDGDIVNKILRASNNHEKEYIVSVDKAITPDFIYKMGSGVPVQGTTTAKCFVKQEGSRKFRIILKQGLNRQIRRMCEHFDYTVRTLTRIRIMNVQLGNLASGKWRYLTPQEIDTIHTLVDTSSKTEEASVVKQYIPKKKSTPTKAATESKQESPSKEKKNKSFKDWRKSKK
jgi:23S rRNA pseudouridine2604 synthase